MSDYNIYAGMTGSFGGADYQGTAVNVEADEAEDIAYQTAIDIYETYEGEHGIKSWWDCFEEFCENKEIEASADNEAEYSEEIDQIYLEEQDNWIEYYIVLKEEDEDFDESEYYEIN